MIPAVTAELDVFSTLTAKLAITARTPGGLGNFILLLNNQNALSLSVTDLGVVNGLGPVVLLNSLPASTFTAVAAAIVSGSLLITAALTGTGSETFAGAMSALTPGLPAPLVGNVPVSGGSPAWYSANLAGGADAQTFDTYKAKLLRRMLPPPYDRRFQSTIGKLVSIIGSSDNDIGGLFGAADFLPNEDV